jgi:hypothetical protein
MMTIGFEISTHFFFDLKFFKEIFEKIKFVWFDVKIKAQRRNLCLWLYHQLIVLYGEKKMTWVFWLIEKQPSWIVHRWKINVLNVICIWASSRYELMWKKLKTLIVSRNFPFFRANSLFF